MSDTLTQLFGGRSRLMVQQRKEWAQIMINWETANKYAILDEQGRELGLIAERSGGFLEALTRMFLRSHRPLEVDVFAGMAEHVLHLKRDFFFFFSDLEVTLPDGTRLGSIHRRFRLLSKHYDLCDASGQVFATIESPIWRIWTFPVKALSGVALGEISKRWGGVLTEVFSDADTYSIELKNPDMLSTEQSAIVLAAAISIDFDYFEHNNSKQGLIDI